MVMTNAQEAGPARGQKSAATASTRQDQPQARRNVEAQAGSAGAPAIVLRLVGEMFDLACEGALPPRTAQKRPECHIRQIAMYLCRVVLSMPYQQIAAALGRDRTTVIHGCAVVEDRRDMPAYDGFVERCERCVRAVFATDREDRDER